MSQITNAEFTANLQLKGIELLKGSINHPGTSDVSLENLDFNINIESKADENNRLVFVIVNVQVTSGDNKVLLGSMVVSCIYSIDNFDNVVSLDATGKAVIAPSLVEILNSISISTTRGLMFSTFKGTFLHNAFLPIIDPRSFKTIEVKPE